MRHALRKVAHRRAYKTPKTGVKQHPYISKQCTETQKTQRARPGGHPNIYRVVRKGVIYEAQLDDEILWITVNAMQSKTACKKAKKWRVIT